MKKIIFFVMSIACFLSTFSQQKDSSKITITDRKDYTEIKLGDSVLKISHDFMAKEKLNDGIQKGANGDYEGAIGEFNAALLFDMENAEIYYNRGLAYAYLKDFEKALYDFNSAIRCDSNYYLAYNERGIVKCRQENCQEALVDFQKAIVINSSYSNVYYNMGITYLKLGNFDDGCKQLNKAKDLGYENAAKIISEYCQ